MTNNPTIDGVSRSALELLLGDKPDHPSAAWKELRALLDAPAVERQDKVQMASMPVERCYDVRAKMIIAFNEAKKAGGDLDDALDAAYRSALRFSQAPQDFAALQSTIAQLQARIAELESGRGEPVYQVSDGVNGWRDVDRLKLTACQLDPEEYECRVLFTAPPVPVAVVLPERRTPEHYHARIGKCGAADMLAEEWNACLDATAALNGERK